MEYRVIYYSDRIKSHPILGYLLAIPIIIPIALYSTLRLGITLFAEKMKTSHIKPVLRENDLKKGTLLLKLIDKNSEQYQHN